MGVVKGFRHVPTSVHRQYHYTFSNGNIYPILIGVDDKKKTIIDSSSDLWKRHSYVTHVRQKMFFCNPNAETLLGMQSRKC